MLNWKTYLRRIGKYVNFGSQCRLLHISALLRFLVVNVHDYEWSTVRYSLNTNQANTSTIIQIWDIFMLNCMSIKLALV